MIHQGKCFTQIISKLWYLDSMNGSVQWFFFMPLAEVLCSFILRQCHKFWREKKSLSRTPINTRNIVCGAASDTALPSTRRRPRIFNRSILFLPQRRVAIYRATASPIINAVLFSAPHGSTFRHSDSVVLFYMNIC